MGKAKKVSDKAALKKDVEQGKGMAVVAYIIALIPYFAGDKKNKFVRFHAIQGMNLLIVCVVWSVVAAILDSMFANMFLGGCYNFWVAGRGGMCSMGLYNFLTFIIWLPSFIIGLADIIGLVYAAQGKMKEVPILGRFKIIKK